MKRDAKFSFRLAKVKSFILSLALLFGVQYAQAALSGTYTINPSASASASNYTNFRDAVSDLLNGTRGSGPANGPGISGAVTFNVSDGIYNEKLTFYSISGVSATRRVTFQSASGDSSKVIIRDTLTNSATNNFLVMFDGADFITFKKMTFWRKSKTLSSTYTTILDYRNNADSNEILNCRLLSATNATGGYPVIASNYYPYTNDSHNVFKNNIIRGGYYTSLWYGESTSSFEGGTVFEGNLIDSFYYYGLYTLYQKDFTFKNNTIRDNLYTFGYGLMLYYCVDDDNVVTGNTIEMNSAYGMYIYNYNMPTARFTIANNKINLTDGYYGMLLYYTNSDSSDPSLIYNNMISVRGNNTYAGIYSYYNDNFKYYYNNISLNPSSATTTYAMLIGGNGQSGARVYNNNLVTLGSTGYTLYSTGGLIDDENNNNFYAPNSNNLVYFNGNYTTLTAYRNASGFGANTISVDPRYIASNDLHVGNVLLNGVGRPITGITTDYDNETRNATKPDIGADEWNPPATDAELTSIDSPIVGFCSGVKNVYVKMTNAGLANLTSATISWKINSTSQTNVPWTGSLAPGNSSLIKLGSYNFTTGSYTIEASVASANGLSPDSNIKNNTKTIVRGPGMSGTYTIGGTSPDYATFNAANVDLSNRGVCGPVVFKVRNGTYNEQLEIKEVGNASAINTVTFESESKDSTKVRMVFAAGVAKNYLVSFNGADYIRFRQMTFERTGTTSQTGTIFEIKGGANNNKVENSISRSRGNTAFPSSHVYSVGDVDSGNVFFNNSFKGGYYAIYSLGIYGRPEANNVYEKNIIDSFYYIGMYTAYQKNLQIVKNEIKNPTYANYAYGMYPVYLEGKTRILQNYVYLPRGGYGMYSFYIGGDDFTGQRKYVDSALIANNMISIGKPTSTGTIAGYGMLSYYGYKANYYNNTVNNDNANTASSYGAFFYNTSTAQNTNIVNNCFTNTGKGYAVYLQAMTGIGEMNYNNYWNDGGNNLGYVGSAKATLKDIQTATSQDAQSLSLDPKYSSLIDSLRIKSTSLNARGKMLNIKNDFYGNKRDVVKMDIGANEIYPKQNDAGTLTIDSPALGFCSGTFRVWARIANFGANTISTCTAQLFVNGTLQNTLTLSGLNLLSSKDTLLNFGNVVFATGVPKFIEVKTVGSVNGVTDGDTTNNRLAVNKTAGLSGTFTIGGTSPDFVDFKDAFAALNNGGICGPVVFNVRPGTYLHNNLNLNKIAGASVINTITFQGTTKDSSRHVIQGANNTTYNFNGNATIILNGASWVTFKYLSIHNTGFSTYGKTLYYSGGSHHITFKKVSFKTEARNDYNILSPVDRDTNFTFDSCRVVGGYYGMYISSGSTATLETNTRITNCNFDSVTYGGNIIYYQDGIQILNNTIDNPQYQYFGYGFYMYFVSGKYKVSKNKIHLPYGGYGLYMYYCNGDAKDSAYVDNNFINMNSTQATGTAYAIYMGYNTNNTNFYHNTVLNYAASTNSYAAYFYSGYSTNVNVINNIFANVGSTGYAVEVYNNSVTNMDYNCLYSDVSNIATSGGAGGSAFTTLAGWRTSHPATSGRDSRSVAVNPNFIAANQFDFHVRSGGVNDKGARLSRITTDLDGQTRSTTTPDIGADEFTPAAYDLAVDTFVSPVGTACGDSNVLVTLKIGNYGANTITSAPIKITFKRAGVTVDTFTYNYTGTLASGRDTTITINASRRVNMYVGGRLEMYAVGRMANDADKSNDSTYAFADYMARMNNPIATGASGCSGSASLTLSATWPTNARKDSLYWYTASGVQVGKGATFNTPTLTQTTTYYVQAKPATYHVGPYDDYVYSNPANLAVGYYGMFFDAKNDIVIDSVTVFPRYAGIVNIQIEDYFGFAVGSQATYIPFGGNFQFKIPVKVKVPKGNDYLMHAYGSSSSQLSYNYLSSGIGYPISNRDVDITGSNYGGSNWSRYYLFFYDWVIADTIACPSQKVPVIATIGSGGKPTASASITNRCTNDSVVIRDLSTAPAGYSVSSFKVNFGDGSPDKVVSGGGTIKHKYAAGIYKVTVTATASGGCVDDTVINIAVAAAPKAKLVAKKTRDCDGNAFTFYDSTSYSGGYTRTWSYAVTNTTANEYEYKFGAPGTYNMVLKATGSGSCADSSTVTVVVDPRPVAKIGLDSLCDASRSIYFMDSSTTSSGTITNWSWDFGDSKKATSKNASHIYATDGKYNATLVVTNSFGCSSTNLALRVVNAIPAPSAKFTQKSLNGANSFEFKATDSTAGNTYSWDYGDFGSGNGRTVTHSYASIGKFNIKLTVMNANGCVDNTNQDATITTGIGESSLAPFGLGIAPNPFNDRTLITYTLSTSEQVTLQVYDVLGRVVSNLFSGNQNAGTYKHDFIAPNANNTAGVYFVKLIVGDKVVTKEIIRVK